jgi:DNA-binding MarR family transcriptional regulator/GNAT superfamily N-acetyltransferase
MIDRVRRFNRTVTQQVGALQDRYLARDRSLGEARVLWEIGKQGCDVRELRSRLDLDSGYLSRLLRSLEGDGLITLGAGTRDRRVRTARLTRKGLAERAVLDQRSDALAQSLLDPLTPDRRARLVAAMGEVERLMTAALVHIEEVDPAGRRARYCLDQYFSELDHRFHAGFDPGRSLPAEAAEMTPPAGVFLVASTRGEAVACGGLKFHGDDPAEIKRMWVAAPARGLGVGRRLLCELESRAAAGGSPAVRLDTNRALREAIALYRSAGYRQIHPFNNEPYADYWFEKRLDAANEPVIIPGCSPNARREARRRGDGPGDS